MTYLNPFLLPGAWLKGALHVHSTNSDGRLSPEECLAYYRARGYSFVAMTDHDVVTDLSHLSDADFLAIPGIELTAGCNPIGQSYHLVFIGVGELERIPPGRPVQEAIDLWSSGAALPVLAHPYWSAITAEDVLPLDRLDGLEVYNWGSNTDLGKELYLV